MCYGYIKEQSAARKDGTEDKATITRETGAPVAEPVASLKQVEEKAFSGFLDRIHRMLAAQKQKRTEAASI